MCSSDLVGPPLPGVEVATNDNGELLVKGPLIMMGYWHNPEATKSVIDQKGWFHTGDKAVLENGHIIITGRLKEIIVLSTGEKIAPAEIEMTLVADPLFEQAMAVGEGHPHLALITVLNEEEWTRLTKKLDLPPENASLSLPLVEKAVLEKTDQLLHAFPGYARIYRAALTLKPWTVDNGLLTPTLKLKRARIGEHIGQTVSSLFDDAHTHVDNEPTDFLS